MRESMSEMGSVIMVLSSRKELKAPSPARLDHAGDFTAEGVEPQANAAQLELAVVRTSTTADLAPVAVTHFELRGAIELRKLTRTRHFLVPLESCPLRADAAQG